jgi:hypothetical protein
LNEIINYRKFVNELKNKSKSDKKLILGQHSIDRFKLRMKNLLISFIFLINGNIISAMVILAEFLNRKLGTSLKLRILNNLI